jgi:SapC
MTPGLRFLPPPTAGEEARWRPVTRFAWLNGLGIMPIADRELLNVAHHAPIVIVCGVGDPSVHLLLRSELVTAPTVDRVGRWRPVYRPLALRGFPFLLLDPASPDMRAALIAGVPDAELGAAVPYFTSSGARQPEAAGAMQHLAQLHAGARRLAGAAETLLGAGLLSPLGFEGEAAQFFDSMELMIPDPQKFAALSPARTAALARDGRLALDLLIASHFSARLLAAAVRRVPEPLNAPAGLSLDLDPSPAEIDMPGLGLDDSPLFSIHDFMGSAGREPDGGPTGHAPRRLAR